MENPNRDVDLDDENAEIHLVPGSDLHRLVELSLGETPPATIRWGRLRALVEGRAFQARVETVQTSTGLESRIVEIVGLL